ncbi:hypothetical protein DXG03_001916, partial [Asterophora parasitica]
MTLPSRRQPPLEEQICPWVITRLGNAIRTSVPANILPTSASEFSDSSSEPTSLFDDDEEEERRRVHYESSLYGPLNGIFSALFPIERRFMVKPQGLLRKEFDGKVSSEAGNVGHLDDLKVSSEAGNIGHLDDLNDAFQTSVTLDDIPVTQSDLEQGADSHGKDIDIHWDSILRTLQDRNAPRRKPIAPTHQPNLADASFDSYAGFVVKKRAKGTSGSPDFIIVKATETLVDDEIIAIIEVKLDDLDLKESRNQLKRYMFFAGTKKRAPTLKGYLMMGESVEVWSFLGPEATSSFEQIANIGVEDLQYALHETAG